MNHQRKREFSSKEKLLAAFIVFQIKKMSKNVGKRINSLKRGTFDGRSRDVRGTFEGCSRDVRWTFEGPLREFEAHLSGTLRRTFKAPMRHISGKTLKKS